MRIARVVLRVSDVEATAAFHERFTGLEHRGGGALHAPGDDEPLLELRASKRPGPAPRGRAGLFHVAVLYPTRGALGEALHRTHQVLTGASDHLVSEALYLDDPDGLGLELYRDRPRDKWPAPRPGERVRMATEPLDARGLLEAAAGEDASGATIGHVHLAVADVEQAVAFWTGEPALELMTRYPGAAFLARDGYHHHVGANTWHTRGAPPVPPDAPGLAEVVLAGAGRVADLVSSEGVRVVLER